MSGKEKPNSYKEKEKESFVCRYIHDKFDSMGKYSVLKRNRVTVLVFSGTKFCFNWINCIKLHLTAVPKLVFEINSYNLKLFYITYNYCYTLIVIWELKNNNTKYKHLVHSPAQCNWEKLFSITFIVGYNKILCAEQFHSEKWILLL